MTKVTEAELWQKAVHACELLFTDYILKSILCSWIPFQRDGIGDNICNRELSDFECWWQDGTLGGENK